MRNSGFVSVGHLLANRPTETHVETLRHFCTVIFCNIDDAQIHKSSGFWRFDQFFRSVPVSVESFAQFFGGLLRKHDTDVLQLQLEMERLAWDMVKFDFDRFTCKVVNRKSLYQLFCLFNRFANYQEIPMTLPENALCFLLRELKLPFHEEASLQDWDFSRFLEFVCTRKEELDPKLLKRTYDAYVRDILKEGRVRYRIRGSVGLGGQDRNTRIISITSREMVIYECDGDLDQPFESEPTGQILHRIPLIEAETKVVKSGFSLVGNKGKMLLQVVSDNKDIPNVELVFDASTENHDLFSWNQAIHEATYSTQANQNRLSKIHLRLGFSTESRRADDQHRLSSHSSPPGDTASGKLNPKKSSLPTEDSILRPMNRSSSELVLSTLLGGGRRSKNSSGRSTDSGGERRLSPLALPQANFLKPGKRKQFELSDIRQRLAENGLSDGSQIKTETWKPINTEESNGSFSRAF